MGTRMRKGEQYGLKWTDVDFVLVLSIRFVFKSDRVPHIKQCTAHLDPYAAGLLLLRRRLRETEACTSHRLGAASRLQTTNKCSDLCRDGLCLTVSSSLASLRCKAGNVVANAPCFRHEPGSQSILIFHPAKPFSHLNLYQAQQSIVLAGGAKHLPRMRRGAESFRDRLALTP